MSLTDKDGPREAVLIHFLLWGLDTNNSLT